MPWPDDMFGDVAPPPEPGDDGEPFGLPSDWRALIDSAPDEPPAPPAMPDPLGFTASARAAAEDQIAPPELQPTSAPPGLTMGMPRPATGEMPADELAVVDPLPDGLVRLEPPPAADVGGAGSVGAPFEWPDFLGGPPAAAPEPDAISDAGGTTPPPEPDIEMEPEYASPLDDPRLDVAGMGRALADLAPEREIEIVAEYEFAKKKLFAARAVEAATAAARRAEDEAKAHRQSLEASQRERETIDAEAKQLAGQQVDNEAWFKSRSVPQMLAAFVAAIVGGLNQKNTGGRNLGLEAILRMADQHVETQKFNLQQQRAGLADRRGALADRERGAAEIYRAGEVHRMATLDRVIAELEAEREKYDPKGAAAIALSPVIRGARAARAAALDAHADKVRKELFESIRLEQDQMKIDETRRKNLADEAAKRAKAGAAGAGKLTSEQLRERLPAGAWIPPPGWSGTVKEYSTLAEAAGKGLKVSADIPATGDSKDQLEREIPMLPQPDGKPFYARGDITEIKELRSAVPETGVVVSSIDAMIRLIAENGYEPDFLKSTAWQQAKAHWSNAVLTSKSPGMFALGVLTGPDVGILGQVIGTDDPTQLRDTTEGLKTGRANIIKRLQGKAKSLGYKGDVSKLPEFRAVAWKRGATKTADDASFEDVLRDPNKMPSASQELGITGGYDPDLGARYGSNPGSQFQGRLSEAGGLLPSQRRTLDGIAAAAADPKKRAAALRQLDRAARDALSPGVRAHARSLFTAASAAGAEPVPATEAER